MQDPGSTWQQAFEEAFGRDVNDFYRAFEAWLPSQIPSYDQVTIQMLWPEMETNPLRFFEDFLYLDPDAMSWEDATPIVYTGNQALWGVEEIYLTITYPAGAIGKATVSLWWSDNQIEEHLLGWYKRGELTDQCEEATPIRFTGTSRDIQWKLPAHPNTLPRLAVRNRESPQGRCNRVG